MNTLKLAGNWRFELFYWDFILGAVVAATVAALTFGSLGFDGFLFSDDLMREGRRNIAYGMGAGVIFNLGNKMPPAAVSLAGMSVALPVGLGVALIVAAIWSHAGNPLSNPTMLLVGLAVVFASGIFFSTFIFNLFFMNLTVKGEPVEILDYLRASWKRHALGILGGMMWAAGVIASFVVAAAPEARLGPAMSYGLGQGAAVVGALWGLLAWKELRDTELPIKILMGAMLILFAGGVVLLSAARLYR